MDNKLCNSSEWLQGYIYDFHVCAGQGGVGTCQVGACYESPSPQQHGQPHLTTQAQPSECFPWPVSLLAPALHCHWSFRPFPIRVSLFSEVQMPTLKHPSTGETEHPTLQAPNLLPGVSRFRRIQHFSRALLCQESSSGRGWESKGAYS